jgi:anti-sigma factor RsiW
MSKLLGRARFRRDHRWAPERMSEYLDAELGRPDRDRMQRHLGECRECRRLLAGLQAVANALARLPAPPGEANALQLASAVRPRLKEPPGGG